MNNDKFQKAIEEKAQESYSKKELVNLAADKFADLLVRHMHNEEKKRLNKK